jgi:hypothetical protein
VSDLFGEAVFDVPVSMNHTAEPDFFTHRKYWDMADDTGYDAPHIATLRNAIDLADTGVANKRHNFPAVEHELLTEVLHLMATPAKTGA